MAFAGGWREVAEPAELVVAELDAVGGGVLLDAGDPPGAGSLTRGAFGSPAGTVSAGQTAQDAQRRRQARNGIVTFISAQIGCRIGRSGLASASPVQWEPLLASQLLIPWLALHFVKSLCRSTLGFVRSERYPTSYSVRSPC